MLEDLSFSELRKLTGMSVEDVAAEFDYTASQVYRWERGEGAPKIELDVELAARNRPDGLNEVDLKLSVSANRDEEIVFHVEVLFGGLFQVEGVPADEMEAVLLVECPRYLFPFARRIISDMTAEGGFPPFLIDPIDFAGVYAAQKAAGTGGETVGHA